MPWIGLALVVIVVAGLSFRGVLSSRRGLVARPGMLRLEGGRLPNVLLLTVDTLRADHVQGTAPPGVRLTPALERLARRGTTFLRAIAPAPATRPALAGLMTGSYPGRHQVLSNFGSVAPSAPLLAAELQRHGYATAAFYGNRALQPNSGLGRGFASYRTFVTAAGLSRDETGVADAVAWLAEAPRGPWFLWLHLMSPHGPYNSSPRSEAAAATRDLLPDVDLVPSSSNYGLGPIIPKYQLMQVPPRSAEYRRRYRDEVVFVDAQIERVLAALDTPALADTLIIFTADHGESLGENEYFFQHGWLPNEPSLHVPMIWSLAGHVAADHSVAATVSLTDVTPTLLAGIGVPAPPLDGRDLSVGLAGGEPDEAVAFSLTAYANQVSVALSGRWKLVHTPPPLLPLPTDHWHAVYPLEESWVLHDLQDGDDTKDVAAEHPEQLASLRHALRAWERRNGLPSGTRGMAPVDADSLERLRALGYVD